MSAESFIAGVGIDPTAPNAVAAAAGRFAQLDGYRAIDDSDRLRKPSRVRSVSEDRVLKDRQRQRLTATQRDVFRNFAVCTWLVNKHLDYVSRFRFRSVSQDEGWNREYEAWRREASRPERFDLAGRHDLDRAVRLTEGHRVLDGDAFWGKYSAGRFRGLVELIEGDRVRDDGFADDGRPRRSRENVVNGVEVDPRSGRAVRYGVANRTDSGFAPGRTVPARNLIPVGYYMRFDQVRGVSPLASACNTLKDIDESFDYARAKIKLSQMLGLVQKRSAEGQVAEYVARKTVSEYEENGGDPYEDGELELDLSGGLFSVGLDPGDELDMLESKTPASETVAFLKLMIQVACRALDIPYSFFSEDFTNFYGQRGSFLSYLQSAQVKRADLVGQLDRWHRWRSGLAVADGSLQLPSGWEYSDLRHEHLPIGQPWWDPAKEITASLMEIAAGINSPQNVCHALGRDYEENIDDRAAAERYAARQGVEVSFAADTHAKAALADEAGAVDPNDGDVG